MCFCWVVSLGTQLLFLSSSFLNISWEIFSGGLPWTRQNYFCHCVMICLVQIAQVVFTAQRYGSRPEKNPAQTGVRPALWWTWAPAWVVWALCLWGLPSGSALPLLWLAVRPRAGWLGEGAPASAWLAPCGVAPGLELAPCFLRLFCLPAEWTTGSVLRQASSCAQYLIILNT